MTQLKPAPTLARQRPVSRTKKAAERDPAYRLSLDTEPQEAKSAAVIPVGKGEWQYEPKWDGFRCLAFKAGDHVELRAKSGKSLSRYFPEVVAVLRELKLAHFVLDGELTIERAGILDFDALQMRLHPAESRIERLSKQTPAHLILFNMLVRPDGKILDQPLREWRNRRRRRQTAASAVPAGASNDDQSQAAANGGLRHWRFSICAQQPRCRVLAPRAL